MYLAGLSHGARTGVDRLGAILGRPACHGTS